MADNLPAIRPSSGLDYSNPDVIQTLKSSIAVDATPEEFSMFLAFCQSTGLNPYKKEIWFIKTKAKSFTGRDGNTVNLPAKVQMMTGINGFFQIANNHPAYDGMEEPEFEEDDKGFPIKCTVRVWRKDRRFPSVGTARIQEYHPGPSKSGKENWDIRPFHMLAKVAKSIALREAFPQELNGMYTEDEYQPDREPEVLPQHPLDKVTPKQVLPPSSDKKETGKQAQTRELMQAGNSWVYSPGFILVDDVERKKLWSQLVRSYGAITDEEGFIHTNEEAIEIAYALVGQPGRNTVDARGLQSNGLCFDAL